MTSYGLPGHQARNSHPPFPDKMRVAIYAGMFIQDFDGATKTLFELIRSLRQRRAEVAVWSFSSRPTALPGVPVSRVPAISLPFYPDYKFALPGPSLFRQIRKFKPDLIHLTVPDSVGLGLAGLAKVKRIPLLMSYHTDFISYLDERNLWYLSRTWWPILRWYYNRADSLLVPSRDSGSKLARHGIQAASVWTRGLPVGRFSPSFRSESLRRSWGADGRKVILFSGRFAWFKGLQVFVQVYDLFKKEKSPAPVFVLLGRGPLEEDLKKRMPDAVFPGYLAGDDLSTAYASADILLFPSTTETFGNVIQEAIASGLPAVVSDEGGCQEIINQTGGGLVAQARKSISFYQMCHRLLTDETLYQRIRNAGLLNIKGRDWETVNRVVLEEYTRLVSSPPRWKAAPADSASFSRLS
ncbi:MAG TPA: glycosyltransferase family 1 protein [Candidatus Aminicenantes bacterium]|nr:glycosyltransferase family 1 protein [Candidatus Aminicenantes bacterium]